MLQFSVKADSTNNVTSDIPHRHIYYNYSLFCSASAGPSGSKGLTRCSVERLAHKCHEYFDTSRGRDLENEGKLNYSWYIRAYKTFLGGKNYGTPFAFL